MYDDEMLCMMMKIFKLKIHYCIFYRITIFIQNFLIIKFLTEKYEENYEGDFFKNVLNVHVCEFIQNLNIYKYIYIYYTYSKYNYNFIF